MYPVTILTPTSIVAATSGNQSDIDLRAYKGNAEFFITSYNVAGTLPTLAAKLQASAAPALTNTLATGTTAGVALRTAADTNIKLAASFTTVATLTPSIKSVILFLKKHATLTAGTLTLGIYADSSGPTGSALATATVDVATLTDAFVATTFTITKPPQLAAATKYWLVLTSDYTEDATANVTWRNTAVGSGGNSSVFATGWTAGATVSFNFSNYAYYFSDVTGGGFTAQTTGVNLQLLNVNIRSYGIVRLSLTLGGTDTPQYVVACGAILKK